ncbi:MAG: hypothetical protein AAFR73_09215 [Pseudomonadota bacterium]
MKHELNTTGRAALGDSTLVPTKGSLTVDVEKYQEFLDGSDMTDAQKEEFLQALWSIIVNFVDLGFGVHSLQEVCGKATQHAANSAVDGSDEVNSDHKQAGNNPLDSVPKDSLEIE